LLNSDLHVAEVNPIFGIGSNHFRIVCAKLYSNPADCNIHPHNIYMEWLIEQGAIGFTLFTGFLIAIAAKCSAKRNIIRRDPLCLGLFIALMMRLWPFASTTGFFSRWGAPPFWLILGALLACLIKIERRQGLS
jgi:O-antigen ligase